MRAQLPNLLTLANLCSGCLAILFLLEGQIPVSLTCLAVSLLFDFFDGFLARKWGVSSPIGKDLDSLADIVSFGVFPGFIVYDLLDLSLGSQSGFAYLGFLITASSAWRLARFNNDPGQAHGFMGLPTPANTLFFSGLLATVHFNSLGWAKFLEQPWLIAGLLLLFSYLLNARIPLFKAGDPGNPPQVRKMTWALALALPVGFILFRETILSVLVLIYLAMNLFSNYRNRQAT